MPSDTKLGEIQKPRPYQYASSTEFISAWKAWTKGKEVPKPTAPPDRGLPFLFRQINDILLSALQERYRRVGGEVEIENLADTDSGRDSVARNLLTVTSRAMGVFRDCVEEPVSALMESLYTGPDVVAKATRLAGRKCRLNKFAVLPRHNFQREVNLMIPVYIPPWDDFVMAAGNTLSLGAFFYPPRCRKSRQYVLPDYIHNTLYNISNFSADLGISFNEGINTYFAFVLARLCHGGVFNSDRLPVTFGRGGIVEKFFTEYSAIGISPMIESHAGINREDIQNLIRLGYQAT